MNNPPAFPTTQYANGISPTGHDNGMTLRDYFAAKALANAYTQHDGNPDKVAEWAYAVADAMMKAREA
jgi:hypothetical protein